MARMETRESRSSRAGISGSLLSFEHPQRSSRTSHQSTGSVMAATDLARGGRLDPLPSPRPSLAPDGAYEACRAWYSATRPRYNQRRLSPAPLRPLHTLIACTGSRLDSACSTASTGSTGRPVQSLVLHDTMDPRQRLALGGDSDDESPFKAAPQVAANKIARYSGQPRKSKLEREKEAEAERQRKEEEEAARAYREFVEAFGGDEETGPSTGARPGVSSRIKTVGKGFVKAGGEEKYNPLAQGGPASAGPSSAPAMAGVPTGPRLPTGPRAMMQSAPSAPTPPRGPASTARPTAASLMGDDDEVRCRPNH